MEQSAINECGEQLKRFVPVFTAGAVGSLVVELRVPNAPQRYGRPRTEAGFFDLLTEPGKRGFWEAVKGYVSRPLELQPAGIYVTMNGVDPVYLSRANNRMGDGLAKISADDGDVVSRRWVVVDVDPKRRIAGVSSTDEEKAAARSVIDGVRSDLSARGFRAPMFIDSGNGFHLWYRVDLPRDDGGQIERTLKQMARRHNTPLAGVDTTVFNPSRIIKIPGTWARKGDSTPERPHRMCRVLEVPSTIGA